MGRQEVKPQRGPVHFCLHLVTANVLTLLDPKTGAVQPGQPVLAGMRVVAKMEVLKQQFIDKGMVLIGLQETRLRETATLPDGQFFMYNSSADDQGHHGVALWASKVAPYGYHQDKPLFFEPRHFTVVECSPRLLIVVQITAPFLRLTAVVAHAPSEPRVENGAARSFWLRCRTVLGPRVGGLTSDSIGAHAADEESSTGQAFHDFLAGQQLWLPATFRSCHTGDSHTWCSPQGRLFRIDYVAVPMTWPAAGVKTFVWHEFESLQARDDHWPSVLTATFTSGQAAPGTTRYVRRAVRPPLTAPPQTYVQGLRAITAQSQATWATPVDDHYSHVVKVWNGLGKALCADPVSKVHQTYLQPGTLDLVSRRKQWRLHLRHCKQQLPLRLLNCAFACWRGSFRGSPITTQGLQELARQVRVAHAWVGQAAMLVFRLGKLIKHATKHDRLAYLQHLVHQVSISDLKDPRHLFQRVRQAFPQAKASRRSSFQPLPAVLDSRGQMACSTEARLECWRAHFAAQEAGDALALDAYPGALREQKESGRASRHTFDVTCVPTLFSVEQTILGLQTGKAAGYDGITGELLRLHAVTSARVLLPVYAKASLGLCEPLEFRGGALVPLAKRASAALSCEGFRSILVSSLPGKVYHRQLRTLMMPALQASRGDVQAGAVPGISTEAISMVARTFRAIMAGRRHAWALTFFDIRAAYYLDYRVLRQMLCQVGDSDRAVQRLMHDMGVPHEALGELFEHLSNLDTLARAGVSEHMRGIICDLLQGPWFRMDFGAVLTLTHRGVRPGDCLADILFAFTFSAYMASTEKALDAAGLSTPMPESSKPLLWPDLCVPRHLSCGSWADDFIHMTVQACHVTLSDRVVRAVRVFVERAEVLGIQLTFAIDKTAALLAVTEGQLPPVLTDSDGRFLQVTSSVSGVCHRLPVVDAYKHLGGIATASGTPVPEVWFRHSLAMNMLRPLKTRLFSSPGIPFSTRRHLLNSLAMSRYTFGSAALQLHAGIHRRLWSKNYVALWRTLWKRGKDEHYVHSYAVLGQAGAPTPPLALALSRAVLLKQVLQTGPVTLLHLLTVHWHEKPRESWLGLLVGDVAHVSQYCTAAKTLCDTGSPLEFLVDALREDPKWWVRQVKAACKLVQNDLRLWIDSPDKLATLGGPPPATQHASGSAPCFECTWCHASFPLRKHLGAHLARAHRVFSPARHLAHGDTCVSCLKCFRTVARHQSHLKRSDYCLMRTCHLVPFLPIEQVRVIEGGATKQSRRVRSGHWAAFEASLPSVQAFGPHQLTYAERMDFLGEEVSLDLMSRLFIPDAYVVSWVEAFTSARSTEGPRSGTTTFWDRRPTRC